MCTERKDRVRAQQESGHLQATERGFRRNQTFQHFHIGLLAPRTEKKQNETTIYCISHPVLF